MQYLTHLSLLLFLFINPNIDTNPWKLAKDADEIKVYTRTSEGSDIKEFKAITTTTLSIKQIEAILDDADNYGVWQANVTMAKTLEQITPSEKILYSITEAPWPISDRDIVVHSKKTTRSDGSLQYILTGRDNYRQINEDAIRIIDAKGSWTISSESDGSTKIIYQFYGNPNGNIPTWLINGFIVDGPFESLKNLRNGM